MKRRVVLAVIPALFICPQAMAANEVDKRIIALARVIKASAEAYMSDAQLTALMISSYRAMDKYSEASKEEADFRKKSEKVRREYEEYKKEIRTEYKKVQEQSKKDAILKFLAEADNIIYKGRGNIVRGYTALEMELDI